MKLLLRILSVLLVLSLSRISLVQAQQVGQYMQLFYYGSQPNTLGPIGRFSPAFKGKSEIKLAKQDELLRQLSPFSLESLPSEKVQSESVVTTSTESGETVVTLNGKRLSPAETKKYHEKQRVEQKAAQEAYINKLSQYAEAVTSEISKALNEASADGWEVVQMASLQNGGLVYLLRKIK